MKRDMELCRKLLFFIEDSTERLNCNTNVDGYSQQDISYNCKLLHQAGLIDRFSEDLTGNVLVGNLTWAGHDFLDQVREEKVWNKTKDLIHQKGLPFVLDVIKQVATAVIKAMTTAALSDFL